MNRSEFTANTYLQNTPVQRVQYKREFSSIVKQSKVNDFAMMVFNAVMLVTGGVVVLMQYFCVFVK